MNISWKILLLPALLFFLSFQSAWGDVIVVANRSDDQRQITLIPARGEPVEREIVRGDAAAFSLVGKAYIKFAGPAGEARQLLDSNSAYSFVNDPEAGLMLEEVPLGGDEASRTGGRMRGSLKKLHDVGEVTVNIYVDEPDEGLRALWLERLKRRVQAASFAIERHCKIKLAVGETGVWAPNPIHNFEDSLRHFEKSIERNPAAVAIGFTRRHAQSAGRAHMGGIRGPLASHILIREWEGRTRESDRVEVLVHELGHYFGAIHSGEEESVMRPLLAQPKGTSSTFAVRFDPAAVLAMNLISEEIRTRGVKQLIQLSPETVDRLEQIYRAQGGDESSARGAKIMQLVRDFQEKYRQEGSE